MAILKLRNDGGAKSAAKKSGAAAGGASKGGAKATAVNTAGQKRGFMKALSLYPKTGGDGGGADTSFEFGANEF